MLQVLNLSPLAHLALAALDTDDVMWDVVVAKGAFTIEAAASGGKAPLDLVAAPQASAIALTDTYFGALNKSSVRTESDLAPFKPKCDVVVIGSAHSPTGEPVKRVVVGVDIDGNAGERKLSHRLSVCGPRNLARRSALTQTASLVRAVGAEAPRWRLDDPQPFLSIPLRYEAAFGGELKVAADDEAGERLEATDRLSEEARDKHPDGAPAPLAHSVCQWNPVGCGYLEPWHPRATRTRRYPGPSIERTDAPLTDELVQKMVDNRAPVGSDPALTPQGFGVIAKAWAPRLKLAGTFDDEWTSTRSPYLPRDFDEAFWNCAHPAMQCTHLTGGEAVTLTNLVPSGTPGTRRTPSGAVVMQFRVPDLEVALRLEFTDGRVIYGRLPIDTLVIDLDAMLVQVAWRLRVPGGLPVSRATLLSIVDFAERSGERVVEREHANVRN